MGILATMEVYFHTLIVPGITLLYPLVASLRIMEKPSTIEVQQWLTYWIVYSLLTLLDLSFYTELSWPDELLLYPLFSIWRYVKIGICMALVAPAGAASLYKNFVRKIITLFAIGNSDARHGDGPQFVRRVITTSDSKKEA